MFSSSSPSQGYPQKSGLSLRGGVWDFPRVLSGENRTNDIPSRLILPLLVVFTLQLEILVITPSMSYGSRQT